jgi:hypothetical protein
MGDGVISKALLVDSTRISLAQKATNPMKLRADWSRPSIHAVPSLQPVVFEKLVKTNSASVLGDVARSTMLITMTLASDQYTKSRHKKG